MKSILICGERSFVGRGLAERLTAEGYEVDVFSRGECGRVAHSISGNVNEMDANPNFASSYDVVVNFIFINKGTVEENLRYAKALHRFCQGHGVKLLIQISSISVYPNEAQYVDEKSVIETDLSKKGRYGAVKIAIDRYFCETTRNYKVVVVRPGYVVSDERETRLGGIVKPIFPKIGILLGKRQTSLPLVDKSKVHEGLVRIIRKDDPLGSYLFLEGDKGTKMDFARRYWHGVVFPLPERLTLMAVSVLRFFRIFSSNQVEMVKGLFKTTWFDPSESEYDLQMSFSQTSVGVIGGGAYGSYVINRLNELPQRPSITLYEVGDCRIKNEEGIGLGSNLVGAHYSGLTKGRYFGYGGASAKWGGQLLLFTHNDFKHPNAFLKGIVEVGEKYRSKVFSRFGFSNAFPENVTRFSMFTKTGIWLGYFGRNLYKWFKISKSRLLFRPNTRISRLIYDDESNEIRGVEFLMRDGRVKHAFHDRYFLCAGAFESNRIVLSSGMVEGRSVHFADQVSQSVYQIKGSLVINGEDFQYGVRGSSLITKRLVGEVGDVSFFAHPIYNTNFPFFQGLKELMFQGKRSLRIVWSVLLDIPSVIGFAWSVFIQRKVFVYKNEWHIGIDIENQCAHSKITLSEEKDTWGIPKLDVDFQIGEGMQHVFDEAKRQVRAYLEAGNVRFSEMADTIHVEKGEDVYHPYGMFMSDSRNLDEYFGRYPNLLIVNTGILPRAGGLNTTAVCFPLIEEYVARYM